MGFLPIFRSLEEVRDIFGPASMTSIIWIQTQVSPAMSKEECPVLQPAFHVSIQVKKKKKQYYNPVSARGVKTFTRVIEYRL